MKSENREIEIQFEILLIVSLKLPSRSRSTGSTKASKVRYGYSLEEYNRGKLGPPGDGGGWFAGGERSSTGSTQRVVIVLYLSRNMVQAGSARRGGWVVARIRVLIIGWLLSDTAHVESCPSGRREVVDGSNQISRRILTPQGRILIRPPPSSNGWPRGRFFFLQPRTRAIASKHTGQPQPGSARAEAESGGRGLSDRRGRICRLVSLGIGNCDRSEEPRDVIAWRLGSPRTERPAPAGVPCDRLGPDPMSSDRHKKLRRRAVHRYGRRTPFGEQDVRRVMIGPGSTGASMCSVRTPGLRLPRRTRSSFFPSGLRVVAVACNIGVPRPRGNLTAEGEATSNFCRQGEIDVLVGIPLVSKIRSRN